MTFSKSQHEKLVAQQERLIREFPWLWGLTSEWYLGYHEIIVKAGNDAALDELSIFLMRKPHPQIAYWLYLTKGRGGAKVVKLECFDMNKRLAENIEATLQPDGFMLTNILTVEPLVLNSKNRYTIFRSRKRHPCDLHQIIFRLA